MRCSTTATRRLRRVIPGANLLPFWQGWNNSLTEVPVGFARAGSDRVGQLDLSLIAEYPPVRHPRNHRASPARTERDRGENFLFRIVGKLPVAYVPNPKGA